MAKAVFFYLYVYCLLIVLTSVSNKIASTSIHHSKEYNYTN